MGKYKITYANKKYKQEIITAKTRLEAINKSRGPSYASFKIKKVVKKKNK